MKEAEAAFALVCLFVVLSIGGAAKLARVSVPVAFLGWAVYFGSFLTWLGLGGSNWTEAFGWTLILNIFTGLGVLPTALVAWTINKVVNR